MDRENVNALAYQLRKRLHEAGRAVVELKRHPAVPSEVAAGSAVFDLTCALREANDLAGAISALTAPTNEDGYDEEEEL